jgi:hypothetical protein
MAAGGVAWFVRRNGAKVKKWTDGSGMAAAKAVMAYAQILGKERRAHNTTGTMGLLPNSLNCT